MEKIGVLSLAQQPIRDHPDAVLVTIDGSIDPKTQTQLKEELQALLAAGKKKFFLDCTRLTYVNSSGLAYLLSLVGTVKPNGGSIVLAALDPKIVVIFKMMGIMELFQFYPTFKDALRDLDEKLARELSDVGPALKLEEPPKPVAAAKPKPDRGTSTRRAGSRTDRITKAFRPVAPPPSENPISQFFRWLFGGEEARMRRHFAKRTRR